MIQGLIWYTNTRKSLDLMVGPVFDFKSCFDYRQKTFFVHLVVNG